MPTLRHLGQDARMYLSRALNRSLAPPDWLSVNLTLRCNLSCTMCTTCYDAGSELTTAEILDLIDQAALWGVRVFNPLGGEPFLRPDLERILAHAARKDFHVSLTTNGTLITPRRAARLAQIPPEKLHVIVSLDGPAAVHDTIRGPGTFRRALDGYLALRAADARHGNPHRKVLANTLVHARNLEELPEFLDWLAAQGFDGVQLLQLFRRPGDAPPPAEVVALRVGLDRLPALEQLVAALQERIRRPPSPAFRIQNAPRDLDLMVAWAAGRLEPLQAPCWAGFKELYINADGRAIMCDGNLDFLAGAWGDVRRQTLREIWEAPELKARRETVRRCRTPCLQECYLRPQSDRLTPLVARAGRLAWAEVVPRLPRPGRPRRLEAGVLTLELSDTCDCALPGCPSSPDRLRELLRTAPAPLEACFVEPRRWSEWRDRHYVDFGRGFMGQELVRRTLADLRVGRLGFGTLALRWRGEPLLHPEFLPILRLLLEATGPDGLFHRLRIETSALLLDPDSAAEAAASGSPQAWWVDLDRAGPHGDLAQAHLAPLLAARGTETRVVVFRTVPPEGLDPEVLRADLATWEPLLRDPARVAGVLPDAPSDAFWLRRSDPRTFLGDRRATDALGAAAERFGFSLALPDDQGPRRCPSPLLTPTVTWDGKITLCPWDSTLDLRVGETTTGSLAEVWRSGLLQDLRRDVRTRGVPGRGSCLDCHQCFSPNHVQADAPTALGEVP